MSAYEELVERCALTIAGPEYKMAIRVSRAVLAEVFRTLETVTPEMVAYQIKRGMPEDWARKDFLAAIHASPLAPPAGAP